MSVVIFPREHLGQRQTPAFVLNLPLLAVNVEPQLYHGVPAETQQAVVEETAAVRRLLDEVMVHADRLQALLAPYRVEVSA
jgi:hypothetical protein